MATSDKISTSNSDLAIHQSLICPMVSPAGGLLHMVFELFLVSVPLAGLYLQSCQPYSHQAPFMRDERGMSEQF